MPCPWSGCMPIGGSNVIVRCTAPVRGHAASDTVLSLLVLGLVGGAPGEEDIARNVDVPTPHKTCESICHTALALAYTPKGATPASPAAGRGPFTLVMTFAQEIGGHIRRDGEQQAFWKGTSHHAPPARGAQMQRCATAPTRRRRAARTAGPRHRCAVAQMTQSRETRAASSTVASPQAQKQP
jgi:hypothetical protein